MKRKVNRIMISNRRAFIKQNVSLKLQQRWAGVMASLFNRLSRGHQKLLCLFAFIAFGTYCFFLLFSGSSGGLPDAGKLIQPSLQKIISDNKATSIRNRLNKLESYMYEMSFTEEGIQKRDSMLRTNPGLMDSIDRWKLQLEELEKQEKR